jgi:isopentenyl-diphosphate delta-isomerase
MAEELGVHCPLTFCTSFVYKASVGALLVEHELDHVYIGRYEGPVLFNTQEVEASAWWEVDQLRNALRETPTIFTSWFPLIFDRVMAKSPLF